jgi:hypothetical protein
MIGIHNRTEGADIACAPVAQVFDLELFALGLNDAPCPTSGFGGFGLQAVELKHDGRLCPVDFRTRRL